MKWNPLIPVMLSVVLLSGCGGQGQNSTLDTTNNTNSVSDSAQNTQSTPEGILSSFSAEDLEGNEIDQSILEGHQLTMVNVWATFCTPCIQEMPELGELNAEYQEKGVQIVGLVSDVLDREGNLDDGQMETAKEIVETTQADYLHIVPRESLFGLLSQITSVPTTFFVDETGKQVGYAYLGSNDKETWAQIIEETLQEVAG